jgi:hypothetical protein
MGAKTRLIYEAIRGSDEKGTTSLTLRNTDHVINFEYCNYAVVMGGIRHFHVRTRLKFDDLRWSVIIDLGN